MTRQLTLDLPVKPRYGREDFLVSASNEKAFDAIDLWPRWPDQVMLLIGPEGAGKTHLGAIWAARANAEVLPAARLADADVQQLAGRGAVLIEDADRIGPCEAQLFHLLNLARECSAFVLVTARRRPEFWGLATADLLSRLRLAPGVEIAAPDEQLVHSVLVKLFADRQLDVDAPVLDYIGRRIERSLAAARSVVAALDGESLARGRRITRVIAADVLRELGRDDDETA